MEQRVQREAAAANRWAGGLQAAAALGVVGCVAAVVLWDRDGVVPEVLLGVSVLLLLAAIGGAALWLALFRRHVEGARTTEREYP